MTYFAGMALLHWRVKKKKKYKKLNYYNQTPLAAGESWAAVAERQVCH